jgi:hypothetical protein
MLEREKAVCSLNHEWLPRAMHVRLPPIKNPPLRLRAAAGEV